MKIILNNREDIFEEECLTINDIMEKKAYKFKMIVVKLNDILITKELYNHTWVKEGDDLKIIHLVSGG